MTIRTLTLGAVLLATVATAVPGKIYTVRRGDTLNSISKKLGVTVDALKKANGLEKESRLSKGQTLNVPESKPTTSVTAELLPNSAAPHAGPFEGSRLLDPVLGIGSMTVLEQKWGWVKLQLPTGPGWLPESSLKLTTTPTEQPLFKPVVAAQPPKKAVAKTVSSAKNPILNQALTYRGVRYRWGGTSRSGVDCSGFTTVVFRAQGIKLPRTALEQSRIGSPVATSDLQAGDLVFFRTSRSYRVNHVGIYVGDRKFIHAATGGGHVMISNLDEKYYRRCYATARRVADFNAGSRVAKESQEVLAQ